MPTMSTSRAKLFFFNGFASVLALTAAAVSLPALAQDAPAEAAADEAAEDQAAQEIVVTGSRLARNGFQPPTPVTVVGADRVQQLGASNIGDVLNQLPSFRATQSPGNTQVQISSIGARVLDLRGLGAVRTLTLVDGRRFAPSTAQGTVDLNLIPGILIQRTEVVTGGASAAYGSDAVAGVVNLIIDSKMTGFRGEVQRGISQRGDDGNVFATVAGGTSLFGGALHTVLGVEYEKSGGMGDCATRSWCAEEYSIVGRPIGRLDIPANNIFPNVHTGSMTPGGLINAGPLKGIQFGPDGTPVPFQYGLYPGLFQQGGTGKGQNPFLYGYLLKPQIERVSAYSHSEADLGSSIRATLDLSYGRVVGQTRGAQLRDTGTVAGPISIQNPYLPASIVTAMAANRLTSITVGRSGLDIGNTYGRTATTTYRAVAGLNGELGGSWKWDVYYQYGRSNYAQRAANNIDTAKFKLAVDAVRAPSGQIVCRSSLTAPANGCVPFNLIGENQFSPAALAYVTGASAQKNHFTQQVAAANLQGDLFSTWAGPISLAVGVEHRRDSVKSDYVDPVSLANGWYTANATLVGGAVNVTEGYAETSIPLARDWTLAKSLDFNGAIRVTDYSTSGRVETWKLGGVWEPIDGIRFRVTRSRDIRAPNVTELFGGRTNGVGSINDPRSVEFNIPAQTLISVISGGNEDLKPEKADTWTAGVVLEPAFFRGFRTSIDFYDINVDQAIGQLGQQTIVDNCAAGDTALCALVTRNPTTNVVSTVRNVLLNVTSLKTRGVDFEIDYRTSLGEDSSLSLRGLATYVADLTTAGIDRAGQTGYRSGTVPGVPDYTLDGTATFEKGPVSVTAHGRYIPRGSYSATNIGPEDDGYDVALPNSINTNRVAARFYLDLAATVTVATAQGREFQLFGAMSNVFDRDPPHAPGPSGGTNQILFDPVGRAFRIGVRIKQ